VSRRSDKHVAITRAATELFLAEGFDRASLDQIAQRAGVSKQTIYNHFADKEALFKAICGELTEKLAVPLRESTRAGTDLRTGLTALGEDALAMMIDSATLDLHRLVIAAAARYPDLGRTIYAVGAARMIAVLAEHLVEGSRCGEPGRAALAEPVARRLAEQFLGMLRGFHQLRGLLGVERADAAERQAYVAACVDLLLRGIEAERGPSVEVA
jgi:TetR/AcrR family transcriptional repressor of mexJK operon